MRSLFISLFTLCSTSSGSSFSLSFSSNSSISLFISSPFPSSFWMAFICSFR